MGVFKIITGNNQPLRGGATREEGLQKLKNLDAKQSQKVLEDLRTNLLGADGTPKHGVLKLRNSSSAGKGMEFARMRGLDRMLSKEGTFLNTGKALRVLMERAGMKPETAERLVKQYSSAQDGSIKYKDAVTLINRVLPETSSGTTVAEALENAGITSVPEEAKEDVLEQGWGRNAGASGRVFPVVDHGAPAILKRITKNEPIDQMIVVNRDGKLLRGWGFDGNHLAAGIVPGVITPNRFLVSKQDSAGVKTFHVVTAGRPFKQFCEEYKKQNGRQLKYEGVLMERAPGTRMHEANSNSRDQREIAKGLAAILVNASKHGTVFGDLKPENAFVDGGKITIIDTDESFKHSSDPKKNRVPRLASTYFHPVATKGQQQDLYSAGLMLLEHAYRSAGNLGAADDIFKIGRSPMKKMVMPDEIRKQIKEIIGNPEPGSVEEFAWTCIDSALDVGDNYNARFTGNGNHLLDRMLSHSLLGGREEFLSQHFVPRAQPADPVVAPANTELTQESRSGDISKDPAKDENAAVPEEREDFAGEEYEVEEESHGQNIGLSHVLVDQLLKMVAEQGGDSSSKDDSDEK
jgi:hypothetical protein